ncbi:MAG TPA: hypothetical protein VGK77_04105 [Candidatus Binatia bacterium]
MPDAVKVHPRFSPACSGGNGLKLLGAAIGARARRPYRRKGGCGAGAIIGSMVGHAAAGALIGGPVTT